MIRVIVGWMLGFVSGSLMIGSLISGSKVIGLIVSIITLASALFFAKKYHIKKRNEYYKKFEV